MSTSRHFGRNKRQKGALAGLLLATVLAVGIGFHTILRDGPAVRSEPVGLQHNQDSPNLSPLPSARFRERPVYPYSVIPGGVATRDELNEHVAVDQVVAKHYSGFNLSRAHIIHAPKDKLVHVAYRMDNRIFWTKKKLRIRKGEALVTDGTHYARARCGNRITESPRPPTSPLEPTVAELDPPLLPPETPVIPTPWSPYVLEPTVPLGAPPPLTGEPYFPPIFPVPFGVPPGSLPPSNPPLPVNNLPPDPSPVPEPPTMWLVGLGAAGVLVRQIYGRYAARPRKNPAER